MAWKTMDVQEQRVRFVVEATQKLRPFGALCVAYDISRPTGYLWLQRYREQGVAGIAEQSRKPHHSPRRTGGEVERQVTQLRLRYPDWGARKLRVLLAREGVQLPRNTIHRILQRHDLIGPQERGTAAVQRFERGQPNELWQMDFKGPKGWPLPMGPLSVLDDHSRYLIVLAEQWQHAGRTGAGAPGRGLCALRAARGDADGSRHAVVEYEIDFGADASVVVADAAGAPGGL